ncbi:oxysterol-binding protein-related protein 1-like [Lingula anatina]|uniref:Oxysterol-binding protein-related protein 1-like n=1 Tax=Lingula anatina TaxID=7574 RepID=A0A2R2MQI3_LINAN|nr:oxysterol-binding protein-related protein 1-like [Lingula anatina]|eukprot:XP_023932509.1 oxysterol-binding protein-related protein 1-like [Lingula anatina]
MATQEDNLETPDLESPKEEKFLTVDEELLHYARHGMDSKLSDLIQRCQQDGLPLNLNCKGENKSNRSWSPLHLAAYFGHVTTVILLLKNGAEVNIMNKEGDTPLHKAAYTGRLNNFILIIACCMYFNSD